MYKHNPITSFRGEEFLNKLKFSHTTIICKIQKFVTNSNFKFFKTANKLESVQTTEYRFHKSEGSQRIGCQTTIIHHSSHNPFPTNYVTIITTFNINTTSRVAHPSRAGTTKHAYMKRQTKQGTTLGRGQQLPCEVDIHPVPRQ